MRLRVSIKRRGAGIFLFPVLFSILFCSCSRCTLTDVGTPERITVMTYNTQNIFDAVGNGTEYREFDPGVSDWTVDLYYQRLFALAEVVDAACEGGPDCIALQEVENAAVVEAARTEALKRFRYGYSAVTDIPGSAVQLAFLSRYPLDDVRAHSITLEGERYRDILEITLVAGDKRLVLFNNHWKSKSGGAEETESPRITAAWVLRRRIEEILTENPRADILVLGDLNENADEERRIGGAYPTALKTTGPSQSGTLSGKGLFITGSPELTEPAGVCLYSPWLDENRSAAVSEGSYYYNGTWETIDHVLMSRGLFDGRGFTFETFRPVAEDFLLTAEGYPKRWSSSTRSGYSDHLPLVTVLTAETE